MLFYQSLKDQHIVHSDLMSGKDKVGVLFNFILDSSELSAEELSCIKFFKMYLTATPFQEDGIQFHLVFFLSIQQNDATKNLSTHESFRYQLSENNGVFHDGINQALACALTFLKNKQAPYLPLLLEC